MEGLNQLRQLKRYLFLLPTLAIALILVVVLHGFSGSMGARVSSESLQILNTALDRAAVECYALEGFYPPNLAYLTDRYGIVVDSDLYFVDYSYLGSNLRPNIVVLPAMKGVSMDG